MSAAYIYTLSDPTTSEVRYVGKTVDLDNRLSQHVSEKGDTHKCRWVASLRRQGLKPVIEPLEEFPHEDDAKWTEAERFWIETLRFYGVRLVNSDPGGFGGALKSAETKAKISRAKSGRKLSPEHREMAIKRLRSIPQSVRIEVGKRLRGRKASAETRAKLSIANRGRKMPREAVERARIARIGQKRSDESRRRMSEAQKKLGISPEQRAKMLAGIRRFFEAKKQTPEWQAKEALKLQRVGWRHRKQSPESVRRRALANTGKKRTPETCMRISLGNKGKVISPEARAKMSAAKLGRKLSPEHCAKLREHMLARWANPEWREKVGASMKQAAQSPVPTLDLFGNP